MASTGWWLIPTKPKSKIRGPYETHERALTRQAQKVASGQMQYRECRIVEAASEADAHEAARGGATV